MLPYHQPATSLGGVESLDEHRIQSDPSSDPGLIRLSIGVEDVEVGQAINVKGVACSPQSQDLKEDLRQAFLKLASVSHPFPTSCHWCLSFPRSKRSSNYGIFGEQNLSQSNRRSTNEISKVTLGS